LQDMKANTIPLASQHEMLCDLLVKYAEAAQLGSCKSPQNDAAKRIRFTDYVGNINVGKDDIFLKNEKIINMLCRIGLEKIVSTRDIGIDQELLRQLVDANLVTDISTDTDLENNICFALTTKGWNWMKSKNFQKKSQNSLPTFPTLVGIETNFWNELSFRRAKLIHDYYNEYPTTYGYIMFAFPQNKQLLFGCEISETVEVSYVCPYVFNEAPLKKDVDTLCEILNTSKVKVLTIVSLSTIGLNDMPMQLKNAAAGNIAFIKLRN
ncbi:MAG: hypothetical protein RR413_12400, partial [Christensenellaceae bacterium]